MKSRHSSENMLFQIINILTTYPIDDRSMPRCRKCPKYWIWFKHILFDPIYIIHTYTLFYSSESESKLKAYLNHLLKYTSNLHIM